MTSRELAWRVFAGEYNVSTLQLEPAQEREPGYLITPLGAKINRVYVVGVLTDLEKLERVLTDLEKLERNGNTHYRARVSDRTGVFYIYAGQYDPQVIKVMANLEPPTYVAVIGKSRIYSPSEGVSYVSIRPENIIVVDKTIRDAWLLDACKSLKSRMDAVFESQQMEPPEIEKLVNLGFDATVAEGVIKALKHYNFKQPEIEQYKNMLVEVLKYLVLDNGESYISTETITEEDSEALDVEFKTGDELTIEPESEDLVEDEDLEFEPSSEDSEDSLDLHEKEDQLLEIINSFDSKEFKDGVPWHKLMAEATDKGIDKNIIEDLVNNLLETGRIYEPILGRIKCSGL
jgi:RPA family protein